MRGLLYWCTFKAFCIFISETMMRCDLSILKTSFRYCGNLYNMFSWVILSKVMLSHDRRCRLIQLTSFGVYMHLFITNQETVRSMGLKIFFNGHSWWHYPIPYPPMCVVFTHKLVRMCLCTGLPMSVSEDFLVDTGSPFNGTNRSDVASFMLSCLTTSTYDNKMVAITTTPIKSQKN